MSAYSNWNPEQQAAFDYRQDGEYLQIFSVLYYVFAGFAALGGCFPIIHFTVGAAMLSGAIEPSREDERVAMVGFGGLMMVIASVVMLISWTMAICLFLTARNLAQAKSHAFCFVMACLICLNVPFGTILGILTILTLNRPSMKARFAANRGGQPPVTAWQPPPEKKPPE